MIFTDGRRRMDRKGTGEKRTGFEQAGVGRIGKGGKKREARPEREVLRERQYAQLADMNKQRLMGYAESFRELAGSFKEEFAAEILGATRDRQGVLEEHMLWESRQLISSNLNEMASIMTRVASEELCYEPMEDKKQKILVHALRSEGIYAEALCYLPRKNQGRTIGMVLYTEKRNGISSEEVADMLSVLLKNKLEAAVTSPYMVDAARQSFLFVEEPRYIALTGLSKAVKESETVSGDNYAILQSDSGQKFILISDGTGSGKRANADSGRVLDLMEKMLESGFGIETAVGMVNNAVFAKGEESSHPTLDVCSLDLYTGDCDICKIGGASTFLKRGKYVEKITRGSLPLGIFQALNAPIIQRRVYDGDYLVFMTDGVLDALEEGDNEDLMTETIRNMAERNPQEMAEKLLQLVLRSCGGRILDDMTILVMGIWEN